MFRVFAVVLVALAAIDLLMYNGAGTHAVMQIASAISGH
jgi:hypothetical protein